jgi:Tol biopolymer transport system component
MASVAPKKLGPYEILSPLGSGGMGEVYRARDPRLNREVAVKILRGDLASDPQRRARFEREAQTVAGLNHPNIVALFEVGNDDGVEYSVSELVDGEPLRSLIQPGGVRAPLPVRRVVDLSTQLADGLAAAHAAGIVHRDLKPENIMVTRDGRVKILDFGLARQMPPPNPASGSASASDADTILQSQLAVPNLTNPGMVLGTAAYMSPEQARGLETGYRSDQFSFGLIVYEMLSGKQAFTRPSPVETMAAIVREEPPPLDPKIPVILRWILDRCLEKDSTQRFDSTRDLYQQLRILREHFSEASSSGAGLSGEQPATTTARRRIHPALLAAALLLALGVGAAATWLLTPQPLRLDRYKLTPFAVEVAAGGVWSPDGKTVAYASKAGSDYEVFLRDITQPTPHQITQKKGFNIPIGWDPDGVHIIFFHRGKEDLKTYFTSVSRVGGATTTIITSSDQWGFAAAISPDGHTLARFGIGADGMFHLFISDPIGSPWKDYGPLPSPIKGVFNSPNLSFAPGGKRLLLAYDGVNGEDFIWLLPYPYGSGRPSRVFQTMPHALSTPQFSWLPDGKHLIVATSTEPSQSTQLWLARLGSESMQQLTVGSAFAGNASVSPDGKKIVYTQMQYDFDVVSISTDTGDVAPIISTAMNEYMPQYAATGGRLVYVTDRGGATEIWLREPDASTRPLVSPADIPGGVKFIMAPALSPDGSRVIFSVTPPTGVPRLWMTSVSGGNPIRVTNASDNVGEYPGDWSPDGSRFVFRTYANGQPGLAVVTTDGTAAPRPLITLGPIAITSLPSWSPVEDKIAYRDTDGYYFMDPDGTHKRLFFKMTAQQYLPDLAFSKDGKTLYGALVNYPNISFVAINADTGAVRTIRELTQNLAPISNLTPTIRLSVAPDGKSITYATGQNHVTMWLFEGWNNL